MGRKVTTAEFIERARETHGNKYGYSQVDYITNKEKVCLICPLHGEFQQAPSHHLNGKGCIKCGFESRAKKKTKTTEQFIAQAKLIHGEKYNYSNVKYTGKNILVDIICPKHGEFKQRPKVHLMGCGCSKCGLITVSKKKRLNQKDFISRSIKIHGDKYSYSSVEYFTINDKVKITCQNHGHFWLAPRRHMQGLGCPTCSTSAQSNKNKHNEKEMMVQSYLFSVF